MTQENKTITVRQLDTDKELGVFTTHASALAFCQENRLIPVTASHGFQFASPLPLPDSPAHLVIFVYSQGDKQ